MAYASSKPEPGTVYFKTGSPEQAADIIAAQDRARAMNTSATSSAKSWAPWLIGGLVVGSGLYFIFRD